METKPYVIVVGTDYSQHAEKALRAAYQQALKRAPAELHVVHVSLAVGADSMLSPLPFAGLGGVPVLSLDEQRDALVKYLDSLTATLPDFREVKVRIYAHVTVGAPALTIPQLASQLEADLIVVGTHGHGGVTRWLLGSVAESVVRQAACPVLVVPPEPSSLAVPAIEPPCPQCVAARSASAGSEMWCEQHREHHGRRHTYSQRDRVGAETNFPLIVR